MNINIDTDKLLLQIEKLKSARDAMNEVFEKTLKENKESNEYWSSETSRQVDKEFEGFNNSKKEFILKMDIYIEYLKEIVAENYINFENQENKMIDEKIATS